MSEQMITIRGSYGDFTVDASGTILFTDSTDSGYLAILRFDPKTFAIGEDEFDILDVGYWYTGDAGKEYEPPELQWRAIYREAGRTWPQ